MRFTIATLSECQGKELKTESALCKYSDSKNGQLGHRAEQHQEQLRGRDKCNHLHMELLNLAADANTTSEKSSSYLAVVPEGLGGM